MKIATVVLLIGLASVVLAQDFGPKTYRVSLQVRVVDDEGKPVEGAEVLTGFEIPRLRAGGPYTEGHRGLTSRDGLFAVTARTTGVVFYGAKKSGYYDSLGQRFNVRYNERGEAVDTTDNRLTVVLKKIKTPAPMYARKVLLEIPVFGEPLGFDLESGDWISPHGRGRRSDFVFHVTRRLVSLEDFDATARLQFSHPQDGIQPFRAKRDSGSVLLSPQEAPLEGYAGTWERSVGASPQTGRKGWKMEDDINYIFRVRTVVDQAGRIVSANYGKIYGEIASGGEAGAIMGLVFTYYFNPKPNNRSLEFDRRNNLAKGQPGAEHVNLP
jgi:hypothetical protein